MIKVDIMESGNDLLVFIHPYEPATEEYIAGTDELIDFLDETPEYIDGENITVDLVIENGALIIRDFLLCKADIGNIDGSCPYPIILPYEFREEDYRKIPDYGTITFFRNTSVYDGGLSVQSGFIIG